jgi:hypothetical protein
MSTPIQTYPNPLTGLGSLPGGSVSETGNVPQPGNGVQGRSAFLPPTGPAASGGVSYVQTNYLLTDDEVEGAIGRFDAALGSLNLSLYTDVARLLAQALVEQVGSQRANAILEKKLQVANVQNALLADAQKDIDAADKIRSGALTTLIITIVVSAITIVASAVSIGASVKTAKADAKSAELGLANKEVENNVSLGGKVDDDVVTQMDEAAFSAAEAAKQAHHFSDKATAVTNGIKSLGDTVNAVGRYLQSMTDAEVKVLEAEGKKLSAQAQYLQTLVDQQKGIEDALNDFIKAMVKFLADLAETRVGAFINKL